MTPETLRNLLDYNPKTGRLTWRKRPAEMFLEGTRSREWACNKWNTRYAGKEAFTAIRNTGYLHGRVFDTGYQAHRVAWAIYFGEWPNGEVDHVNGDRTDNRIINLRDIPKAENQRNMKRSRANKSGVCGVAKVGNRWRAYIAGKQLGTFKTLSEAAAVRKLAEAKAGFHPNHGRAA